jgi:hypothetical protein
MLAYVFWEHTPPGFLNLLSKILSWIGSWNSKINKLPMASVIPNIIRRHIATAVFRSASAAGPSATAGHGGKSWKSKILIFIMSFSQFFFIDFVNVFCKSGISCETVQRTLFDFSKTYFLQIDIFNSYEIVT